MLPPRTSTFTVYPAIDLRGGRVVRLRQGDFGQEQVYSEDPLAVLGRFVDAGATWVHVVDLDGALTGGRRQTAAIARILARAAGADVPGADVPGADLPGTVMPGVGLRVQVAGGLRDRRAIAETLDAGAARVVIGTAALQDPSLVAAGVVAHGPERIAIALDVRDGMAVGQGWVAGAPRVPVEDALLRLIEAGATTFAVTAIDRDGLLGGPDLDLLEQIVDLCPPTSTAGSGAPQVIASGGISSIVDLEAVRALGCAGAIVGRAIYDGTMDLADAVRISEDRLQRR